MTSKSYKDGSVSDPYTPTVQFGYDGVALTGCTIAPPGDTDTYPSGRRTSMCDGSGGTSWVHDQVARVTNERRAIGKVSVNHYIDYTYNPDGSLKILQTPPMKQMNYTYDGAGRPTQLVDSTDNINFALNATYAPAGELAGVNLGSATGFNGFTVSNTYNNRLQPTLLSATSPSATVFSDSFDFHLGAGDNGNVFKIVNNRDTTHARDQNFMYDSLNRIQQAYSSGSGTYSWGETFSPTATGPGIAPITPGIDAWGNLTNRSGVTGKTYGELLGCPANTNNQLTACSNPYDAAGNMTGYGTASYVYDAENRLVWTSGYRYVYDGNGQRVEKCQAASATTACPTTGTTGTLYWRGTGSDTLAETDLAGNDQEEYIFFSGQRIARRDVSSTGATIGLHYYFSDHLGSHGVVETVTTTGTTSCDQDIDFYPYGGVENDYCSSTSVPQRHKFTGKERDAESGLDNFGARYNASSLGRFMTPDWAARAITVPYAVFGDPQSLNLYGYVRNDPVSRIDADGHGDVHLGADEQCNTNNYCQHNSDSSTSAQNQVITLSPVTGPVVVNQANQTATATTSQSTATITTNSQGNSTATIATITTSVTVSTAAVNSGQVLSGSTQTSTTTINSQGNSSTVNGSTVSLNPQQAQAAAGSGTMAALNNVIRPPPTRLDRVMDHKVGIGGTVLGSGIAIGCALAEPCGAGVIITGIAIAGGSSVYDMATH
ncbi:MAG TPA: RHS repeat-associated core domain-containing protein [Candidatus Dormibacteraeota bacterium]|nr:RHS repeat-associated core domain-containing protein [Candidatus Dormibacteraeota bacterium]